MQKRLNHSLQHKKAPNYLLGAFYRQGLID